MENNAKVTIKSLVEKKKSGNKVTALTAYDYATAKILDESGIDIILVGDSLGMVVLGYPDTLKVTMDEMIHHTKAVARGVKRAMVVGDMPYLSYGVSEDVTIQNAGRFIKEGGAHAVKLEGGVPVAGLVKKMTDLGIPVMGHIGMQPTHTLVESGYHVHGRGAMSRESLIDDAVSLEKAGVFSIVLECVDSVTASEITKKILVPTLGIGAGGGTDGQILVSYDMLGMYEEIKPKFVKRYAQMADIMRRAFLNYKDEVEKGIFPGKENTY